MEHSARVSGRLANPELRCKNGCGFYGNPMWEGYCSKCYKDIRCGTINAPSADSAYSDTKQKAPPAVSEQQHQQMVVKAVRSESSRSPVVGKNGARGVHTQRSRAQTTGQASSTSANTSDGEVSHAFGFAKFEEKKKGHMVTKSRMRLFKKTRGTESTDSALPATDHVVPDEKAKAGSDFQDFLKTLKKPAAQDIVQQTKRFIRKMMQSSSTMKVQEQAQLVQEFYQSLEERLQTHTLFRGTTEEQHKSTMDNLEKFIMTQIYHVVWCPRDSDDEQKDIALSQQLRHLRWVTSKHLDIEEVEKSPKAFTSLQRAQHELLIMDTHRAPSDKLKHIVSSCKHIFNALMEAQGGPASADEFLPVLIFVVLQAAPQRLQSNIQYISRFSNQNSLMSGESAYHFTNVCCAVSFLENVTGESFHVSEEEFKRLMNNDPLASENGENEVDAAKEEPAVVRKLLALGKEVDALFESQEKQISDCQQLKKEFALFRTDLVNRVQGILSSKPSPLTSTEQQQEAFKSLACVASS